ncbi:Rieske 2Fe-2S domain-containing protein [candidate division KSB1 bacterium]|nr:Rieske 2Fe-2S domain-containing protein [candidate division KSB1 bacterium]
MQYLKLATIDEFQNKNFKSLSVLGKKIGIFKKEDGSFYAMESGCKHQGADITKSSILNNIVTCPRHGWKYNLETGECVNRDSPKLRKHDLIIEGNDIKVSLSPVE